MFGDATRRCRSEVCSGIRSLENISRHLDTMPMPESPAGRIRNGLAGLAMQSAMLIQIDRARPLADKTQLI